MPRSQSRFVCQSCGAAVLRWEGQCRTCGEWNTLVETVVHDVPRSRPAVARAGATPVALAEADDGTDEIRRPIGIGELDRVLGGGLVAGSVVLVGGEPGIGKSTLLLLVAAGVATGVMAGAGPRVPPSTVLYATGEESVRQVRLRAARLGLADGPIGAAISVVAETGVGRIVDLARAERPGLLVVDSVQTVASEELDGPPGSVGQVREATLRLMELAKADGIPVVLVGHVTKDGTLAGPKTLEHLVDVVLSVEGDRTGGLRLLRAAKNRYGSTEEVGVFEMGDRGLMEVADPARAFLAEHDAPAPGSVVAPVLEGSRPLLVEVQALVAPTGAPTPRRTASGVDQNRLALLVAVLGRRAGIGLSGHDVYANLAGGLSVTEPGLDLPLALALASSLRDRPLVPGTVAVGEVGLLGELRSVGGLDRRLREAARLGFTRAIVPRSSRGQPAAPAAMEVLVVGSLAEAIRAALGDPVAVSTHRS
ncbi:MAG: DNA repair protein RadA [Chloroflexota bacterium]|nr:DNA repair protein RadA [Chloroflexota bacterium]